MQLFEEIVLTSLMMYIGIKKAIALAKKIQENAAVIASRLEIEEKSRALDQKRINLVIESKREVVSNVHEINPEMSPKISKVDISWPKDIIEDDFKNLRIRTPSVPEIQEIISEDISLTIQTNNDSKKCNDSFENLNTVLESSIGFENSLENIPELSIVEATDKTVENLRFEESNADESQIKLRKPEINDEQKIVNKIKKVRIEEINVETPSNNELISIDDQSEGNKEADNLKSTFKFHDESFSNDNDKPETNSKQDDKSWDYEVKSVTPFASGKCKTGLTEEINKDMASSSKIGENVEGTVDLECKKADKNEEIYKDLIDIEVNENIEENNNVDDGILNVSVSHSSDSSGNISKTLAERNVSNSDDEITKSYFETALDSNTISEGVVSDTISEISSIKSSVNDVSDHRILNKAEFLNKTNESLRTINSDNLKDNTVFLCSAKPREETSLHNHLVLCDSGAVIGNSDLGQTVHGSFEEEGDEIFYNAASEVDSEPFWLIFSGEYTKAMNKDWHSGHFCCWQCDESLTGQRYVLRDDHPYCIKCYESVFANPCEDCNKTIGIDSKDLSYKDKHWHEACFLCNKCHVSLVDKQFGSKGDKIYCGNCYDTQFASRCDGCTQIFRAGTKKMEYKTRQWHEQCFCCCVCKSPIGTKSFIPREQEIYCATCYEEKFATRCVKCSKIITSGGVTYKNEPWHRECFTCTNCNASLAGQRFTSRDEKPYCADCFGELFAKRCTACCKPITGIGGTRFISFEDRHWHNDCFICASCKSSLVGRGFITDGDDIICPDCAKAKLI